MVKNCKNCGSNDIKGGKCQHCGTQYSINHASGYYGSGMRREPTAFFIPNPDNNYSIDRTLKWGDTCDEGYVIEISSYQDFRTLKVGIKTNNSFFDLYGLNEGTYFAKVRNMDGNISYSPILMLTI